MRCARGQRERDRGREALGTSGATVTPMAKRNRAGRAGRAAARARRTGRRHRGRWWRASGRPAGSRGATGWAGALASVVNRAIEASRVHADGGHGAHAGPFDEERAPKTGSPSPAPAATSPGEHRRVHQDAVGHVEHEVSRDPVTGLEHDPTSPTTSSAASTSTWRPSRRRSPPGQAGRARLWAARLPPLLPEGEDAVEDDHQHDGYRQRREALRPPPGRWPPTASRRSS